MSELLPKVSSCSTCEARISSEHNESGVGLTFVKLDSFAAREVRRVVVDGLNPYTSDDALISPYRERRLKSSRTAFINDCRRGS